MKVILRRVMLKQQVISLTSRSIQRKACNIWRIWVWSCIYSVYIYIYESEFVGTSMRSCALKDAHSAGWGSCLSCLLSTQISNVKCHFQWEVKGVSPFEVWFSRFIPSTIVGRVTSSLFTTICSTSACLWNFRPLFSVWLTFHRENFRHWREPPG